MEQPEKTEDEITEERLLEAMQSLRSQLDVHPDLDPLDVVHAHHIQQVQCGVDYSNPEGRLRSSALLSLRLLAIEGRRVRLAQALIEGEVAAAQSRAFYNKFLAVGYSVMLLAVVCIGAGGLFNSEMVQSWGNPIILIAVIPLAIGHVGDTFNSLHVIRKSRAKRAFEKTRENTPEDSSAEG